MDDSAVQETEREPDRSSREASLARLESGDVVIRTRIQRTVNTFQNWQFFWSDFPGAMPPTGRLNSNEGKNWELGSFPSNHHSSFLLFFF